MKSRCLYCYEPIGNDQEFHTKCSREFFGLPAPPVIPYSLTEMDEVAKTIVERSVSVPGVQAKLSMSLVKAVKEKSDARLTVVGALGGQYILKPPAERYREMPANEHLTMRMAEAFGIPVVPSSLIRLASGELSYITRRIDREETGEKIHMLDMFQITEAFNKYKGSMEQVGKALDQYSENTLLDKLFFLELTLFSFLSGNNDMHLKNFSMIDGPSGWVLSPAYDLLNVAIILPEDNEELALSLARKKNKLKKEHFEHLGNELGLTKKQMHRVFTRMKINRPKAIDWIDCSFLSDPMTYAYKEVIDARYRQEDLF